VFSNAIKFIGYSSNQFSGTITVVAGPFTTYGTAANIASCNIFSFTAGKTLLVNSTFNYYSSPTNAYIKVYCVCGTNTSNILYDANPQGSYRLPYSNTFQVVADAGATKVDVMLACYNSDVIVDAQNSYSILVNEIQ